MTHRFVTVNNLSALATQQGGVQKSARCGYEASFRGATVGQSALVCLLSQKKRYRVAKNIAFRKSRAHLKAGGGAKIRSTTNVKISTVAILETAAPWEFSFIKKYLLAAPRQLRLGLVSSS